jgi:hypothetical protein
MAASEHINWDQHYGKSFKWGYVPDEQWAGPSDTPKNERIGLIAKHTAVDWDDWKDAIDHPEIQKWKENWSTMYHTLPQYKKDQLKHSADIENQQHG